MRNGLDATVGQGCGRTMVERVSLLIDFARYGAEAEAVISVASRLRRLVQIFLTDIGH